VFAGGRILRRECFLLRSFRLRDVRVSSKAHAGAIAQGCDAERRRPVLQTLAVTLRPTT
jgi:hypothetical protein